MISILRLFQWEFLLFESWILAHIIEITTTKFKFAFKYGRRILIWESKQNFNVNFWTIKLCYLKLLIFLKIWRSLVDLWCWFPISWISAQNPISILKFWNSAIGVRFFFENRAFLFLYFYYFGYEASMSSDRFNICCDCSVAIPLT